MLCPLCHADVVDNITKGYAIVDCCGMAFHLENAHMPKDGAWCSCGWCGWQVSPADYREYNEQMAHHLLVEVGLENLRQHIEEHAARWLPFAYEPSERMPF